MINLDGAYNKILGSCDILNFWYRYLYKFNGNILPLCPEIHNIKNSKYVLNYKVSRRRAG